MNQSPISLMLRNNPRYSPMLDERKRSLFFVFRLSNRQVRLNKSSSEVLARMLERNKEGETCCVYKKNIVYI